MSPRPLLVIPEAGKVALKASMGVPDPTKEPWVAHPLIRRVAALHVRRQMYGPARGPTMRERLLMWTSFNALMYGRL